MNWQNIFKKRKMIFHKMIRYKTLKKISNLGIESICIFTCIQLGIGFITF